MDVQLRLAILYLILQFNKRGKQVSRGSNFDNRRIVFTQPTTSFIYKNLRIYSKDDQCRYNTLLTHGKYLLKVHLNRSDYTTVNFTIISLKPHCLSRYLTSSLICFDILHLFHSLNVIFYTYLVFVKRANCTTLVYVLYFTLFYV